ncbi:hypothetical protein BHE74_00047580 [Ensete ventricosum]|nr:hypothetical protein BHE74_00047580 [Ensete ventricosum]
MVCHTLVPYCCNRTSTVRLGHTSRDDKGKAERTNKLPSHGYKTPVSATISCLPMLARMLHNSGGIATHCTQKPFTVSFEGESVCLPNHDSDFKVKLRRRRKTR